MAEEHGNGELTRSILRTEIKLGLEKQTNAFNARMDQRFKPVLEHINKVERGEWTDAQKDAILRVVTADRDAHAVRRGRTVPVIALAVSIATLAAMIFLTLAQGGFHA
jgi:hypothetical protein